MSRTFWIMLKISTIDGGPLCPGVWFDGGTIIAYYYYLKYNGGCSSERLNDLITVSSTWELTPVGTRYS